MLQCEAGARPIRAIVSCGQYCLRPHTVALNVGLAAFRKPFKS
jgi:hypothetical protein